MHDYCVVGGGIVGLATAWSILQERPTAEVVLLEKSSSVGVHQSTHNSGVIHSGIYYEPRSLKAELCRSGMHATKKFAAEHDIPFKEIGKLIVATDERELGRMGALKDRAADNDVAVTELTSAELRHIEPNVTGLGALLVRETGIIDYGLVTAALAELISSSGAEIQLGTAVLAIAEHADKVTISTSQGSVTCRQLIACAGLQSDRVARMAGLEPGCQIVPFRGEYFQLPPSRSQLVKHLIYPVPDPDLPFLGVHLSPTIDGRLTVGPNAVLGLAREKYQKFSWDRSDVTEMLAFSGLRKVARAHLRTGARELRNSVWKRGYLNECRKYCPALRYDDLLPREAGIRAQAVLDDGTLVHDFLIRETSRTVHVLNAPSPAATSALPIGAIVAQKAFRQLS